MPLQESHISIIDLSQKKIGPRKMLIRHVHLAHVYFASYEVAVCGNEIKGAFKNTSV